MGPHPLSWVVLETSILIAPVPVTTRVVGPDSTLIIESTLHVQPHHPQHSPSCLISEAKQSQAWLALVLEGTLTF
jgi:hypothetical protein